MICALPAWRPITSPVCWAPKITARLVYFCIHGVCDGTCGGPSENVTHCLIKIFTHTRFALVKCDPTAPDHPHSAATRGNPTHSLTEQAWCLISWQMSNDNRQWHPCYDVFFFWPDVQKQKRQHTNARCFTVLCTFEINKLLKELVHIHVQLHAWLQTARSFRWPRHDYSANAIGKKPWANPLLIR